MITGITFAQPYFLWLLLLIPVLVLLQVFYAKGKKNEVRLSSFETLKGYVPTLRQRLLLVPFILRLLAVAAIVIALARPQSSSSGQNVTTEGIDIVIAFDISSSMLAEDLKPNRIEAAKKVAEQFIDGRPTDRI